MIALLLICSTSWCQNDTILPIENVKQDSALIAISALRVANAKMIELKYEKEINNNLQEVIRTDSIIIESLNNNISYCEIKAEKEIAFIKKERNIAITAGAGTSIILLILLILSL